MVVGTCCLQGRQPLPWGRSPVRSRLRLHFSASGSCCDLAIYSHLYCSSRDGGRDLLSSGKAAPTMGKVPCEFRVDWPTFIFQLVAPDVIWHIYSHLYCSSRDGGRDLLSSGKAAPTMGKVPCEFWVDWPKFIFQPVAPDVIWHIYSHFYCFSRHGGRDLLSSGKAAPTMGKVPCEFRADWPGFIFQPVAPDVIWHIYSHFYCSSRDGGRDLLSSGEAAPTMGKVPCEFWADWPGFIFQPVAPVVI